MQVKKDILVSLGLILVCAGLLLTANISKKAAVKTSPSCAGVKCTNTDSSHRHVSPWNFLTQGVLHLSA